MIQIFALLLCLIVAGMNSFAQEASPIIFEGHSHNDYMRKRPLFDALDAGFFSVEADIFYANGGFRVAHTRAGMRAKNTLCAIYLEPLAKRVKENNGTVYPGGPPDFVLMLDLKGAWTAEQLKDLEQEILPFKEIFTVFRDGRKHPGAVRIVLSGSGVGIKDEAAHADPRYFSIDGRLDDLDTPNDNDLIARISGNYRKSFSWKGKKDMPAGEKQQLEEYVKKAHRENRKIRFWATPHRPKLWKALLDAGIDWINVDKPGLFKKFYWDYQKASDN